MTNYIDCIVHKIGWKFDFKLKSTGIILQLNCNLILTISRGWKIVPSRESIIHGKPRAKAACTGLWPGACQRFAAGTPPRYLVNFGDVFYWQISLLSKTQINFNVTFKTQLTIWMLMIKKTNFTNRWRWHTLVLHYNRARTPWNTAATRKNNGIAPVTDLLPIAAPISSTCLRIQIEISTHFSFDMIVPFKFDRTKIWLFQISNWCLNK